MNSNRDVTPSNLYSFIDDGRRKAGIFGVVPFSSEFPRRRGGQRTRTLDLATTDAKAHSVLVFSSVVVGVLDGFQWIN